MPRTSTTIETRSSRSPQIPPAISYKLSDKYFEDIGWTSKPCVLTAVPKVVMRAKFSHPTISPWFKKREKNFRGKYPDGRTLYLARTDGTGKIYYPNGRTAVKIEKGGINLQRTRVWVYGPGEVGDDGVRRPRRLCAVFDSLGHGIVYDGCMNKRLVYNQTEGILLDSPSGLPVTWKWHNLKYKGSKSIVNEEDDPKALIQKPLRPVLFANSSAPQSIREKEASKSSDTATHDSIPLSKGEIEFLEEYLQRRYVNTGKILPRQVSPVKPIVLRLNPYIALRIMDQQEISLSFYSKCCHTDLKIGVLYNPLDKLKVVEISPTVTLKEKVLCPFEGFPPQTKSMERLRQLVESIRTRCRSSDV